MHADVCSACHPFYTGKQKILDIGGRVDKFEKRFGKRVRANSVATSTAPAVRTRRRSGGRAAPARRLSDLERDRGDGHDREHVSRLATLRAEYAELEQRCRTRRCTPTRPGPARSAGASPSSPRSSPPADELDTLRGDLAAAQELGAEDASFAAEAPALGRRRSRRPRTGCASCCCRATRTTARTSSSRSRRARAARSRRCSPATCCGCTCATPSARAGRPSCSTRSRPISAATSGARVAVRSRRPDDPVWARLKYEGGVHRVQRVPVTESQGRIHTSAAGVLVLPEAEEVEVEIDPNDLRIDVFRSSGPGGQSVNTTDSAVRITHLPDRHRRVVPEREEPAAEQGGRHAHPAGPAARCGAGGGRTPRPPTRRRSRSARSTAPSGSAPTTSRRTGSATTGSASRPTTSTRCSTASSMT